MTGQNYIGGAWTDGGGEEMTSAAPATSQTLWTGRAASTDQAWDAMHAAASAFPGWSKRPLEERVAIVERYSGLASERKEEMALLIARETGKPLWDARTEAGAIAGKAKLALSAYHDRTPTETKETPAATLRIAHRPHGAMVVIGPFNFPGHLPNGHIVPALIAGNTVVFKPSEQTPAVAELMVSWWHEAGLPDGVLNLVQGGRAVGEALIGDPRTNGVLFTGGVKGGLAIHRALAGRPEVILALELGGNNPLIAWDIEDADAAARVVAKSAFITSGQRCTCARRLIVPDGAPGDRIVEAVANLIPRLRLGVPEDEPEPFLGPVIDARSADAVLDAQEAKLAAGAKAIVPAGRSNLGAAFVTPGLLDVTHGGHEDEEVFGPLLQVIRTPDFGEALHVANDTRFGLAAGLLSDDEALWDRFKTDIRAGIVNWNRQTTGASGAAPFGGPGLSGNHRPAGYYSADYCAWPMASMMEAGPLKDEAAMVGVLA
ncbi:succinylglutamate-semialdehyde dehydrogenase [Parvularcula dongshanensis]|uniref:L-glutamate gamma-semialdehyde dehydrogenase n=1 Tax=Parvularcula dongshanensis TaxID=1173995 RepID=A0A840I097_9PROT|nr:succinylglutamate-semialdehyde dehydrogenase [Parvularcula dongshanensis]MBB4657674.1 succinylglutamic semialdehyde dehydrogenase [Parvularcula dongshanensis]